MRRTHSEKTFQTFYFKDFFKKYKKKIKEIKKLRDSETINIRKSGERVEIP